MDKGRTLENEPVQLLFRTSHPTAVFIVADRFQDPR
jgi:hypothetical protein